MMPTEKISILHCQNTKEVYEKIAATLEARRELLPVSREATIFLKPNLNSNMNALTGNTTDLRLLAAAIKYLKAAGYKNIFIGDGTSSGFYRYKINVITRLKVDNLAKRYGVKTIDLNYAPFEEANLSNGKRVRVAQITRKADFFINLPKIKTHFETLMSVCLKNLIGCVVGLAEKQKIHYSLFRNIIHLNEAIHPDLHIVDALVAMEGTGPTTGTPIRMDTILLGSNPYLLDLLAARLAGIDYLEIPTLRLAKEIGYISDSMVNYINNLALTSEIRKFKRPKVKPLAAFVNNQKRQKYFIALRLAPGVNQFFNLNIMGKLLQFAGLRQDAFSMKETDLQQLVLDEVKCTHCKKCADYCPMGLKLPQELNDKAKGCIECGYCFLICPQKAIIFKGELGFLKLQLEQYDSLVRNL